VLSSLFFWAFLLLFNKSSFVPNCEKELLWFQHKAQIFCTWFSVKKKQKMFTDVQSYLLERYTKVFCLFLKSWVFVVCWKQKLAKKGAEIFFLLSKERPKVLNLPTFVLCWKFKQMGTRLINKACLTPWVLLERKNTLKNLNQTLYVEPMLCLTRKRETRKK